MSSAVTATSSAYLAVLPGPDRKRTSHLYQYRLTYRNPNSDQLGCVATWAVAGGRMPYQVALERTDDARHVWHCTCADAVYKAEEQGRVCKHVQGLLDFGPTLPAPQFLRRSA